MNKRSFEELEAQEDPTVDTEEDGEESKDSEEEVEKSLPPKKRSRTDKVTTYGDCCVRIYGIPVEIWRTFDVTAKQACMRQCLDCQNARVAALEKLYKQIYHY